MSSIFGLFTKEDHSFDEKNINVNRMSGWNKAYGNSEHEVCNLQDLVLGCYLEKLNKKIKSSAPVLKNDSFMAVIDAVLYNRDEICDKLGSSLTDDISDEKLLFDYIGSLGYSALKDVNGDFAGAVYDISNKTVTLFRDHMGVRPIFYYCKDEMFAFSTDIRGITAISDVDATISERWISLMMASYFVDGLENTEYKNIFCVKPGSYLTFDLSGNEIKKESKFYWTIGSKKIRMKSDKDYQEKLRSLIRDSVKRRLDAVSGLAGAELSGGLDSGVIDIFINRLGRECIYYSWAKSPDEVAVQDLDERNIINDICKQEKITCNYGNLDLEQGSIIDEKTRKAGINPDYDEEATLRLAIPAYVNAMTIAQTSEFINRSGGVVVFSGHGGDEGVSHRCNAYEMFHFGEYYHYFRYMFSTTHGEKHRVVLTLKACLDNFKYAREKFKKPKIGAIDSRNLLKKDFLERYGNNVYPLSYFPYDPIKYIKEGGSRLRLDNAAILAAYGGSRYIFPYMDFRVVDFAVSIPRYQYLRGRKNRYIFREAFKDMIPDSLYRWRTKEEISERYTKTDPNWYKKYNKLWKEVLEKLDKEFWEKYLDFEKLNEISNMEEPAGDKEFAFKNNMLSLYYCAMAQCMVEKSRAV